MAPELLERKKYEGDKIDIFSLGASLFVLLAKKNGFKEATTNQDPTEPINILYDLIKQSTTIRLQLDRMNEIFSFPLIEF